MKFTAQDVKGALRYSRRIFFRDDFSEDEEERIVIDCEATAEALNRIKAEIPTKTEYYTTTIELLSRKLERAQSALQRAGFQDLGGEQWKPPINEAAGELFRLKTILRRISE